MRKKYVLRSGEIESDPEAWILAIYFTPSKKDSERGVLTIGGPKRFVDAMDEVLKEFFGVEEGIEDEKVDGRLGVGERKRLVYDARLASRAFRRGVKDMIHEGIHVSRVANIGRLIR